jgi:phosphoglycerate dehydrogenase-like enzyme
MTSNARHIVFVTSLLEPDLVRRIADVAPEKVEVVYDAELMPPPRYLGDHNGRRDFKRTPEQEARWRSHLARATILWDFPAGSPETGGGLALAPKVRWVQTTSSGVGQMVKRLGLADTDLIVTTARGVHAEALTEFAFLAFLMHEKELLRLQRDQKAHRWDRFCGGELPGKTVTVVGSGLVGSHVGRIAKAFGITVRAVVNRPSPQRRNELNADRVYGPGELREALAGAEFVVLCTPHTPATEGMIDRAAIAAMRPGAVLVNIARGQVVDETAMIAALRSGHIGFAALDVAQVEPLPPDSPLWDLPNVLISPHSASTAPSENRKIADIFCRNLACYVAGRLGDMRNVLDKKRLY